MALNFEFSNTPIESTHPLPPLVLSQLSSWSVIMVSGEDKKSYLQGQLTCDVVRLTEDQSTLGAHCDPKGKMITQFRLFHHQLASKEHGYAFFQRKSAVEKELIEIKKYAVFSKVDIVESQDALIGVMGEQADRFVSALIKSNTADDSASVFTIDGGTAVKISHQRWLLMLSTETAETLILNTQQNEQFNTSLYDDSIWDCADILAGQPRVDDGEQFEHIPQAMNLHSLDAISFNKGCYTGQETIARAKYRGINKRGLFILEGKSDAKISEKITIERQVGDNWRKAATALTQYQYCDGNVIMLAVLPNNLDDDACFRVAGDESVELSLVTLPYSVEYED